MGNMQVTCQAANCIHTFACHMPWVVHVSALPCRDCEYDRSTVVVWRDAVCFLSTLITAVWASWASPGACVLLWLWVWVWGLLDAAMRAFDTVACCDSLWHVC